MLDADGEADKLGLDATGELLLGGELRVGRGGRVDRERLRITEVCNVGEHFEGVDKFRSGFSSSFNSEDDDATAFSTEVFFVLRVFWVIGESWEADPLDAWVVF